VTRAASAAAGAVADQAMELGEKITDRLGDLVKR
jgi:hypothetical protein